jgi:predicted RNase H-like HicB family nuclease
MNYNIKIHNSDEGYAVWCEDLPGCFSQGDSEEEAIENIKIAITEYLEAKKELSMREKSLQIEV